MGPLAGWGEVANVAAHFDANVKGLHLALWAAAEAGVRHAVVASSMSVYPNPADDETYPDPDTPPGATDFYGLTKRLGEQVGQAAVAEHGISLVALRLCLPTPDDGGPAMTIDGVVPSPRLPGTPRRPWTPRWRTGGTGSPR